MIFNKQNYGQPISEELSVLLKEFTSKDDRANVSIKTGVSVSTIRDVSYRTNMLTESNSVAILELIKVAMHNCAEKIGSAEKAKVFFEDILNQVA